MELYPYTMNLDAAKCRAIPPSEENEPTGLKKTSKPSWTVQPSALLIHLVFSPMVLRMMKPQYT